LALSRRYESFSLGKSLSLEKVIEIDNLAKQHGFRLAGFRSFEKPVTERDIDRIKSNIKAEGLSISER
jgi:hypothetical protein